MFFFRYEKKVAEDQYIKAGIGKLFRMVWGVSISTNKRRIGIDAKLGFFYVWLCWEVDDLPF